MITTTPDALLSITDLPSGVDYLSQIPLANPVMAEGQLMRFLDSLLAAPPAPEVLLELLEQARGPLCFVEEEMARCYHNKALPLTEREETCFQQVVAAWRKMSKAYALCARLEQPDVENPQHVTLITTILHRCLYYVGMVILEHYRARRELPAGIWVELHGHYANAEAWGVANNPVEDTLESNLQATHCTAAYATLLLIDIASPYSKSTHDLNLIRRWAGMWAPLVSIHPLESDLELPPYVVALQKDAPLHPAALLDQPDETVRRLDTSRIGLQINHMLSQLHQRITPSQLGLGEETSGHVIRLLEYLARPWTQSTAPRRFRRFATEGIARVATGFEAMHFFISGREFEQPDSASAYSRSDFDRIFTFREQNDPSQPLAIKPRVNYSYDEWSVINHSASGFRLARSCAGEKLSHEQLMVICPHDGDRFLLAHTTWLMQDAAGELVAGVATLPGLPVGVGVRMAKDHAFAQEPFLRAFLLPAVAAIHEPGSIVLPVGIYKASGLFDVHGDDGRRWQLRLLNILQRGVDFDRVSYQAL